MTQCVIGQLLVTNFFLNERYQADAVRTISPHKRRIVRGSPPGPAALLHLHLCLLWNETAAEKGFDKGSIDVSVGSESFLFRPTVLFSFS